MPYVVKLSTGEYVNSRGRPWARSCGTPHLQKAIAFTIRSAASNCARGWRNDTRSAEVIEVTLTEVQKPCS